MPATWELFGVDAESLNRNVGTLADAVTIAAVVIGLPWFVLGRRLALRWRLRSHRVVALSKMPGGRAHVAIRSRLLARQRVRTLLRDDLEVPDELAWLDACYRGDGHQPVLLARTGSKGAELQQHLADAYRRQIRRVSQLSDRQRTPILDTDAAVADVLVDLLTEASHYQPADSLIGFDDAQALACQAIETRIEFHALPDKSRSVLGFQLAPAWHQTRAFPTPSSVDPGDSNAVAQFWESGDHQLPNPLDRAARDGVSPAAVHIPVSPSERNALGLFFAHKPNRFDGILPRVIRHQVLRDDRRGTAVLSLELGQCTYSTVLLDHYPPGPYNPVSDADRQPEGHTGILPVSLLPLTCDGYLVLARRGQTVVHGKALAPAVGGVPEFSTDGLRSPDLDRTGYPNLVAAAIREGQEELGLSLSPEEIDCVGLARFWCPAERGTWLLSFTARTGLSMAEIARQRRLSSALHGRWEADELVGLRYPKSSAEALRFARWLAHSSELTPHTVINTLALLRTDFELDVPIPDLAALPYDGFEPERWLSPASPGATPRRRRSTWRGIRDLLDRSPIASTGSA